MRNKGSKRIFQQSCTPDMRMMHAYGYNNNNNWKEQKGTMSVSGRSTIRLYNATTYYNLLSKWHTAGIVSEFLYRAINRKLITTNMCINRKAVSHCTVMIIKINETPNTSIQKGEKQKLRIIIRREDSVKLYEINVHA